MSTIRIGVLLTALALLAAACGDATDSTTTPPGTDITNPPATSVPFTPGELVKLDTTPAHNLPKHDPLI